MLVAAGARYAAIELRQDVLERRNAQDHEPVEHQVFGPRLRALGACGALARAVVSVKVAQELEVLAHAAAAELVGEGAEQRLELEG